MIVFLFARTVVFFCLQRCCDGGWLRSSRYAAAPKALQGQINCILSNYEIPRLGSQDAEALRNPRAGTAQCCDDLP